MTPLEFIAAGLAKYPGRATHKEDATKIAFRYSSDREHVKAWDGIEVREWPTKNFLERFTITEESP